MKQRWLLLGAISGGVGLGLLVVVLFSVFNPAPPATFKPGARNPAPIISGSPFPLITPIPHQYQGMRVRVLELGIDLPVVEGDGWNAPLFQAAHYPGMKWPGEGGRSLLYAHARAGMFGPLFHGAVGQHIEVTRTGQATRRYLVRQYFPSWPNTDTRWLSPLNREELILLTCTTYNPNDPRIIAVAEPA